MTINSIPITPHKSRYSPHGDKCIVSALTPEGKSVQLVSGISRESAAALVRTINGLASGDHSLADLMTAAERTAS